MSTSRGPVRSSVALIVIVYMVIAITLILSGIGAAYYISSRASSVAKLQAISMSDASEVAASLELPAWNIDRDQIDKIIRSWMNEQEIYAIVVRSANKTQTIIRDADWKPQMATSDVNAPDCLVQVRSIRSQGEEVGTVKLLVTRAFLQQELRRRLIDVVAVIVAVDLVLIFSLYFLLWKTVLKPLRTVEQYAVAVSDNGGTNPDAAPTGPYIGELESLRGSLESMVELLDARYMALLRNEVMLSGVLNSVPQSIFWKDRNSVYMGCNEVFAQECGLSSPDEIVGKTDFDLPFPRAVAEAYRADDKEVVESGTEKMRIIEPMHRADGKKIWVETSKVPLIDADGEVYGLLGVFGDVTERLQAEEEIRSVNASLEEKVRQRTADLENAVAELEAFSYSVSHDLRSPLIALDGFSSILLMDYGHVLDENGRAYLERIRAATGRMDRLVDGLLTLARVTRSEMHVEPVSLSALAVDITQDLRESDPQRNVEFIIQPNVQAVGDEKLLRPLLTNLLGNAWKYTSRHDSARIEFGEVETENGKEFFVRDDGVGYDMAYSNKLFLPFERLHDKDFSGLGIGLATSERIVRRHGGSIRAEGAVEKGATFYFKLGPNQPEKVARIS